MPDPVLNAIDCPCSCGSKARVTASASGALTIFCGSCKFQGFAKSPRAVESLKKRIGASQAPAAAPAAKSTEKPTAGDGDWLKQL